MGRRLASIFFVIIVAVAFLHDRILGIRTLGLTEAIVGLYWIKIGRVPYGWRGLPPSGYLTGWAAVAAGLVAIAIGALFLAAPTAVEPVFCGRHGCT